MEDADAPEGNEGAEITHLPTMVVQQRQLGTESRDLFDAAGIISLKDWSAFDYKRGGFFMLWNFLTSLGALSRVPGRESLEVRYGARGEPNPDGKGLVLEILQEDEQIQEVIAQMQSDADADTLETGTSTAATEPVARSTESKVASRRVLFMMYLLAGENSANWDSIEAADASMTEELRSLMQDTCHLEDEDIHPKLKRGASDHYKYPLLAAVAGMPRVYREVWIALRGHLLTAVHKKEFIKLVSELDAQRLDAEPITQSDINEANDPRSIW